MIRQVRLMTHAKLAQVHLQPDSAKPQIHSLYLVVVGNSRRYQGTLKEKITMIDVQIWEK